MGFDTSFAPRDVTETAFAKVQADKTQELSAEKESADGAIQANNQEEAGDIKQMTKTADRQALFSKIKTDVVQKTAKDESGQDVLNKKAEGFEKKNPELKAKTLLLLREQVNEKMSGSDLLKKVKDFYEDPALADEALEFLESTTEGDLLQTCKEARAEHTKDHGRDIAAGRNIGELSRQTEGLGAPTSLRALYKDITGTPRDANTLFEELSNMYTYKDLQKVIKFMFHALGTDMKAKGPSIPKGQLHILMRETKTLQAILGVYRFFKGRMDLMEKLFAQFGMKMPQKLSFELMSKQFMALVSERYPSSDKILRQMDKFGIENWLTAKIIVLSQMRDGIREVAVNQIYKSLQHRDDLLAALIEALEDLEDEYEDQEVDEAEGSEDIWEEEKEEDKKKKKI